MITHWSAAGRQGIWVTERSDNKIDRQIESKDPIIRILWHFSVCSNQWELLIIDNQLISSPIRHALQSKRTRESKEKQNKKKNKESERYATVANSETNPFWCRVNSSINIFFVHIHRKNYDSLHSLGLEIFGVYCVCGPGQIRQTNYSYINIRTSTFFIVIVIVWSEFVASFKCYADWCETHSIRHYYCRWVRHNMQKKIKITNKVLHK